MFESIQNFWSSTKTFFTHGYDVIHDGIVGVYDGTTNIIKKVVSAPVSIVRTVYADVKSGISGTGNIITHITDNTQSVFKEVVLNAENKASNSINSLGSSLSMPLVIGGVGVLLFLMNKK